MERESAGRIDNDGDGRRNFADTTLGPMTTSQMLLKKELDNLSRDSGHNLGLNGIYPVEVHSEYSSLQLRNIVSRVQTNFSMRRFMDQEDETSQPMQDSEMDVTSDLESGEGHNNNSIPLRWVQEEDDCRHSTDYAKNQPTFLKNNSVRQRLTKTFQSVVASRTTTSSEPEECFPIERTKSPIFYYKNPDFGKRLAGGRNALHFSEMTLSSGFKIKKELRDLGKSVDKKEEDKYRDSTRFIFPPVLSESRLSVCDNEQNLLVEQADSEEVRFDEQINSADDGLSEMDEIRDYNLQLRMRQAHLAEGMNNTGDSGIFLNDTQTSELDPEHLSVNDNSNNEEEDEEAEEIEKSSLDSFDQEDEAKMLSETGDFENSSNDSDEEMDSYEELETVGIGGGDTMASDQRTDSMTSKVSTIAQKDPLCEEVIYPKIVTASSTSVLGRIPPNSWIIWPARRYSEFANNHPIAVLVFLGVIILLAILLGKIFITMGNWFEHVSDINYNPDAMMEH